MMMMMMMNNNTKTCLQKKQNSTRCILRASERASVCLLENTHTRLCILIIIIIIIITQAPFPPPSPPSSVFPVAFCSSFIVIQFPFFALSHAILINFSKNSQHEYKEENKKKKLPIKSNLIFFFSLLIGINIFLS